jgi:hypothetical protein
MTIQIESFDLIKQVVKFFSQQLKFDKFLKSTGRKLANAIEDVLALSLFKQSHNIVTKKSLYDIFKDKINGSYKTLVVNMNKWMFLAALILTLIMKANRKNQHFIKHIDSTDIPVCLFKNANSHKTMKSLASFAKSSKGIYFGLRLHIITDLKRKLLCLKITSANVDERDYVFELTDEIIGLLIADAGYLKKELQRAYYQEGKRIMLVRPKKNMKKIITKVEEFLLGTRMLIELNFRNLKMFYGLITSLPRSVDGYLANYIYSLLAYQIA